MFNLNNKCNCDYRLRAKLNYADYFDKALNYQNGHRPNKERLIDLTLIDLHFILDNLFHFPDREKQQHYANHYLIDLEYLGFFELPKNLKGKFYQSLKNEYPGIKKYKNGFEWAKAVQILEHNLTW